MAAAPAPASPAPAPAAEEGPEPLKYHTLALRVSLHCEGCKREVKRVLQHIEGVYKVSFDSQQHKVVVTGNVAPETLIKKLNKTGKHAELWPEPPKPLDNAAGGGGGGGGGGGKKKKGKNKNKNRNDGGRANEPSENAESNQTASGDHDGSDKPDGEANAKEAAPPAEKPAANAGGGGGGGKKKGKKGHNNSNNGSSNPGAAEAEVASQEAAKKAAGGPANAPPTAMSFPVQVPTYVVSYSSVQPSMSHGGAYHPMPLQHSSYVYSTASPGSYYIFSEENANACSVM